MKQHTSVTFYPDKKSKKEIIYYRIRRLVIIGLVSNLLLLMLYFAPFIVKAVQNIRKPSPENRTVLLSEPREEALKEPLKRLSGFEAEHPPYLYAGHSCPGDSAGSLRDRESHYTSFLAWFDLNPSAAGHFGVHDSIYTVEKGETVYSIAKRFGISVALLRATNNIPHDKLFPGGKLKIMTTDKPIGYYGMDVSLRQNSIDWKAVHADTLPVALKFFIMKATQGKDVSDPYFDRNWQEAKGRNIILGAYHLYVAGEDPLVQAANYGKRVHLVKGNFKPIVDLEYSCSTCDSLSISGEQFIAGLDTFMTAVKDRYGVAPVICTTTGFYNEYLKGHFDDHTYWIVSYEKEAPVGIDLFHLQKAIKPSIGMWQFSAASKVPGVPGNASLSFIPAAELEDLKY